MGVSEFPPTTAQLIAVAREYLQIAHEHPPETELTRSKCIRTHLRYMLTSRLQPVAPELHQLLNSPALQSSWQFNHLLARAELALEAGREGSSSQGDDEVINNSAYLV